MSVSSDDRKSAGENHVRRHQRQMSAVPSASKKDRRGTWGTGSAMAREARAKNSETGKTMGGFAHGNIISD